MRIVSMMFILIVSCFALNGDDRLRKTALYYGLEPVPKDLASLKKVLNLGKFDLTKAKVSLGKKLFFDKNLSLNRDISCASCHSFKKGGADGRVTAIGHKNQKNPFHLNTPTVLNTAFSKNYFWNGRSETLQDQAKGPLQAKFEMAITPKLAVERIEENGSYYAKFEAAFGSTEITFDKIALAISNYEKTLLTRSRFDSFLEGELTALNKNEKEGLELFITKSCVGCHTGIALGGQELRRFPLVHHKIWSRHTIEEVKQLQKRYKVFTKKLESYRNYFEMDFKGIQHIRDFLETNLAKEDVAKLKEGFFHLYEGESAYQAMVNEGCQSCHNKKNNRVNREKLAKIVFPFENRGGFLGQDNPDRFFRVPLLRNVVNTYPYFHNGGIEKLEDAIKLMVEHQHRTKISDEEIKKIVTFLKAVDGEVVNYVSN